MTTPNLLERLPEVGRWIDGAGSLLLGLDFDGTLAPIRPLPDQVALPADVRETLARLSGRDRLALMIVSGRNLDDVAARVGLPDLIYAGNHGMEIRGPGLEFLEPTAAALIEPLRERSDRLEERLATIPGALVERKGLTTSVHYRNVAPDRWEELAGIVKEVAANDAERFVVTTGHRVWEIRPIVHWHKGEAILWTLQHLDDPNHRLVCHVGDDRTDEDAFASLPDGLTVKVGPADVPTAARYRLADPPEVARFLAWLADRPPTQ
ncbi:MAG: trehalose-phosphatase [Isosphaeraceae bacterium]